MNSSRLPRGPPAGAQFAPATALRPQHDNYWIGDPSPIWWRGGDSLARVVLKEPQP